MKIFLSYVLFKTERYLVYLILAVLSSSLIGLIFSGLVYLMTKSINLNFDFLEIYISTTLLFFTAGLLILKYREENSHSFKQFENFDKVRKLNHESLPLWETYKRVRHHDKANWISEVEINNKTFAQHDSVDRNFGNLKFKDCFISTQIDELNLECATFHDCLFLNCNLLSSKSKNAVFVNCVFSEVLLKNSELNSTRFISCYFEDTDLSSSDLKFAKLEECIFQNTTIKSVDFSNAILERNKGIIFDANILRSTKILRRLHDEKNSKFKSYPKDPWTILKENYTGLRSSINFILLFLFISPVVAKSLKEIYRNPTLIYLNFTNSNRQHSNDTIIFNSETISKFGPDTNANELLNHNATDVGDNSTYIRKPFWYILFRLHKDKFSYIIFFILVIYNFIRTVLTFYINRLRDEEANSNITPYRDEQLYPFYWHLFNKTLFLIALIVGVINTIDILNHGFWIQVN